MATPVNTMAIPIRAQVDQTIVLKKAIWIIIVIISILYSLLGSLAELVNPTDGMPIWAGVYLNFFSFVLGVIAGALIFFRSPNSWMAFMTSLMLITFTATDTGFLFWYVVLEGLASNPIIFAIALFLDVLYTGLLTTSLTYVLLAFPEGEIVSKRSQAFFKLMIGTEILLILFIGGMCIFDLLFEMEGNLASMIYILLDYVKAIVLLILAGWPLLRLRRITDPVQRQQIKWIGTSLTGMAFFYAVHTFVSAPATQFWTFLLLLLFTYSFIITLVIAMMRYRLWDMGFLISKAIVYSVMTAVLGMIGVGGGALNIFLEAKLSSSDSSLIAVAIFVLMSTVFHPIRNRMQAIVDKHFKPEEIDFSSAIVEISPEAQLMLTSGDLLRILIKQCVEQLDLASATIYLRWQDGQLVQSEPVALNPLAAHFKLDDKTRSELEKGKVVPPPEGAPYSLLVPLVINRAARPDFLGVLMLGRRNSGEGYPTPLLKSLQQLGADAGKAIYLAQIRERMGHNMMSRLVALERNLSFRQKSLDA